MRRVLPLLLLASACALRSQNGAPCASTPQCTSASVCFLGECRPHSAALALVSAEVRPPNDSLLGVSQVSGLDLRVTAVRDFRLVPPEPAKGSVVQAQNAGVAAVAVPDAQVTFTDHAQTIPDRQQQVSARTDSSGS